MNIIRSNYSNNSIALIQWAREQKLDDIAVCYVDTGWAGQGWLDHVARCEAFVKALGFEAVHLLARMPFADLINTKQGFPTQRYQWCSLHLKGITFLQWLDARDPHSQATVLLPKRNGEHPEHSIAQFVDACEYHGDRKVWHPLHQHSVVERDALVERAGFAVLPHRSLECDPCINSTVADLLRLHPRDIEKTAELEDDVATPMFDPALCDGAEGIHALLTEVRAARIKSLPFRYGCSAAFGCGY
ncbi:MAG: phosphoadenosine phosphosulfate reductase [Pseudomonadota bacterium]